MSVKMRLEVNLTLAGKLQKLKKQAPRQMQRQFQAIDKKRKPALLKELGKEPPKPKFPKGQFPWTNDAQRIAVMAKLKGKRYRRTHRLSRGWQVKRYTSKTGLYYSVMHPWKKAHYVYGDPSHKRQRQQRFHKLIGWYTDDQLNAIMDKHSKRITRDLRKAWHTVTDEMMK